MVECRFVQDDPGIDALREGWEALPAEAPGNPVTLSHAWFKAWRRVFGQTSDNGVLAFRQDGALVGIMPVMLARGRRGPALALGYDMRPGDEEFLASPPRYRMFPVRLFAPAMGLESANLRGGLRVRPGFEVACREALLAHLAQSEHWTLAAFPVAEAELCWWERAAAASASPLLIREGTSPYYRLDSVRPWEELIGTRNKKFRNNMNRAQTYASGHGLEMKVHAGAAQAVEGLAALAAVARVSWKESGRGGEAIRVPFTEAAGRFYRMLVDEGADVLCPVICAMYQEDTPRAAMLLFAAGGVLLPCVTYFDSAVTKASPGRLLFQAVFRWAHDNGIQRIDLNGTHEWVEKFSNHSEPYHTLLLFNRGLYPRLLYRLARRLGRLGGQGSLRPLKVAGE